MRRGAWLAAVLAGLLAGPPLAMAQATPGMITDARLYGDATMTRFVVDLTAEAEVSVFALADPYRIVIDLPELHFQLDPSAGDAGRGLVSAFRFGLISRGQSRIVLDLTGPAEVTSVTVQPAESGQPPRLVVALASISRTAFLATTEQFAPAPAAAQPGLFDGSGDGRLMIVIDPGHGGVDPGATSPNGTVEKDVVLQFAHELAVELRATGRFEVAMTRDDDSYPSLAARVAFAREHHADLFISIHADSYSSRSVRGAAVYTVSEQASDSIVAALAAGENRSDILAGVNLADDEDEVADILIDFARRETKNSSVAFAREVIAHLEDATTLARIPHQEAGFRVLMAPDVPSVLIELGFLSNASDENQLKSDDWRGETAASLVDAIQTFFATRVARGGL